MRHRNLLRLSCRVAAIAGLALVAACSSGARNWAKTGVSDSRRSADYDACRSEMRAVSKQSDDIDQDITASRGSDWNRLGNYQSQRTQLSESDANYAAQVMRDCMRDKGYRPL